MRALVILAVLAGCAAKCPAPVAAVTPPRDCPRIGLAPRVPPEPRTFQAVVAYALALSKHDADASWAAHVCRERLMEKPR